jgi:serine protease Do
VAPLRSGSIALNSEATGALARGDARLSDGSVYQAWTFFGTQGQMVQIDVMSSAFDAFCILQGPAGNEIARDDDGGGGLNARVSVALPVTGTYRIIANTYRQNQYGRYTVRLTGGGMAAAAPVAPVITGGQALSAGVVGQVVRGQIVQGRLTSGDRQLADNTFFQAWTYFGQAGEVVTVDVMSSDFDAYAVIQDGGGTVLARDDDSGGTLNARIVFTLPATGTYRFIANTLRVGATGAYTLSVR